MTFVRIVPDITEKLLTHWTGPLLLVIYVVSQLVSGLLALRSTPTTDPRQARLQKIMFTVLPFVIIPFAIRFPVGLMVYWITTNLWTAGQGIVTRKAHSAPRSRWTHQKNARAVRPSKEDLDRGRGRRGQPRRTSTEQKKKKKKPPAKKGGSTPKKRRPPSAAKSGTSGKGGQVKRRKKKGRSHR